MGFWDRLGAAAEETANIATGGAFGLAWDIATNSQDDNDARQQGQSFFQRAAGAAGTAFDAQMKYTPYGLASRALGHTPSVSDFSVPYHYVARGTSTFQQASGVSLAEPGLAGVLTANYGTITDMDSWRRAWERSDEISPGQSALLSYGTGKPGGIGFGEEDRAKREEFFHNTWAGKLSSGSLDLAANLTLDPLAAAGKGFKVGNAALSSVKAADRNIALAAAGNATPVTIKGNRRANRAAKQIGDLFKMTDHMSASEMMQLPQFRNVPDAAPLAYFFEEANKIDDAGARLAAKRDYFGVALGDAGSIARVSEDLDKAQRWKRFLDTPEPTEAASRFQVGDGGRAEFDYLNSGDKILEVENMGDTLTSHIERMERLLENQNTTLQTGFKAGQRGQAYGRLRGVQQIMYQDGPTGRPVRFVVGQLGARVPGNVNTVDVTRGHDELVNTLRHATWMDSGLRRSYLDDFLKADSREARHVVLQRVENSLFKSAGEKYGLKRDEIDLLLRSAQETRGTWRGGLETRLYSAADPKAVVGAIDPDGIATVFNRPFLQSQIEDASPITDPRMLDQVLRKESNRRVLTMMAQSGSARASGRLAAMRAEETAGHFGNLLLGGMMRGWKFAALFRPAYIARIQVDTQLRLLASMGALEQASRVFSPMVRYGGQALRAGVRTGDLEGLEAKAAKGAFQKTRKARTVGSQRLIDEGFDEKLLNPALDDDEAEALARKVSGNMTLDQFLADSTSERLTNMRASGNWDILRPRDPQWESAYLRSVNHQIRNSPVAREMLRNADDEDIARLIRSDPAMNREWNNFKDSFDSLDDWVATVRSHVDQQLPDDALKARAYERDITKADTDEFWTNPNMRPEVHGESYVPFKTGPIGAEYTKFRNWWFKFASDVPETIMGRHPLYDYSFRDRLGNMVKNHEGKLTLEDVNRYRVTAGRQARKDVANTLFDASHTSNLSHNMVLFAPFFSAWEDTMKKWGKLFYDDPSRAMRFQQAWMAPNDAGWVVDEEGNRVDSEGQAWNTAGQKVDRVGDEQVVMPTPFLKWAGTSELRFRKDNFNLVFQGEYPWLPGAGPLVAIPANEATLHIFKDEADNPILKYVLPYGPQDESIARQAMPTWWRQVGNAFGSNQDHANMANRLMQVELTKYHLGKRDDMPTVTEIERKTKNHFILRAMMASSLVVSASPNPEFQWHIDNAHRIRKEYEKYPNGLDGQGRDWAERFYDEDPDYYDLAVSLSANNTGIQATVKADNAAEKYKNLIANKPEYGWLFVGPDNAPGFNQTIYEAQKGRRVAPGSNVKYRGKTDIVDAADKIEASRGWIEYQKGMTRINTMLEERGLHSFQQRGAEDLSAMKTAYIQWMRDRNPSWSRDFDTQDAGKARELLRVARDAISKNPSLAGRTDMKALMLYMQGRDQVRAILGQSQYQDINHPANQELKVQWDAWVRAMVDNNIGFEQMYNRVLERDDIGQALDSSDVQEQLAGRA